MQGARKYAELFGKSQQHGKLYFQVDSHARGKTFHIWVLPNEDMLTNSIYVTKDAIEVYGIIGGQPGWTEIYGWLHKGKWQEDFEKLVKSKELEVKAESKKQQATIEEAANKERKRVAKLLRAY